MTVQQLAETAHRIDCEHDSSITSWEYLTNEQRAEAIRIATLSMYQEEAPADGNFFRQVVFVLKKFVK